MKITKSRLKEIIMEEISYLDQREINVTGLFNISPEMLKRNVIAMFEELATDIADGDYEKVLGIVSNKRQIEKLITKVSALADDAEKNRGSK